MNTLCAGQAKSHPCRDKIETLNRKTGTLMRNDDELESQILEATKGFAKGRHEPINWVQGVIQIGIPLATWAFYSFPMGLFAFVGLALVTELGNSIGELSYSIRLHAFLNYTSRRMGHGESIRNNDALP